MELNDQSEWRIKSFWMKLLFFLAAAWAVIDTVYVIIMFFIGMVGA